MITAEIGPVDPGSHPSELGWERLAMGELTADQRKELMDHAVACDDCREILRVLGDLEAAAVSADSELAPAIFPSVEKQARGPSWRVWVPMAAAASIAMVLVLQRAPLNEEPVPAETSTERSVGFLVTEPVLLHPTEATLQSVDTDPPLRFEWEPVEEASGYRFELFDADAEPLWSSDLSESTLLWPTEVDANAGSYYWRVGVSLGAGGTGTSGLTRFEIVQ